MRHLTNHSLKHVRNLESGDIFFLYRPNVDVEVVRGLEDLQRFYTIVKPGRKSVTPLRCTDTDAVQVGMAISELLSVVE